MCEMLYTHTNAHELRKLLCVRNVESKYAHMCRKCVLYASIYNCRSWTTRAQLITLSPGLNASYVYASLLLLLLLSFFLLSICESRAFVYVFFTDVYNGMSSFWGTSAIKYIVCEDERWIGRRFRGRFEAQIEESALSIPKREDWANGERFIAVAYTPDGG